MLPRALSSNLCSLLPDEIRLCLCAEVELDASGDVVGENRASSRVHERAAKLTYGGVARALGFTDKRHAQPEARRACVEGLRVAYELSRLLRGQRMKRGALDFDLPEAKIILDEDERPPDRRREARA